MLSFYLVIVGVVTKADDEFNSPHYEWVARRTLRHPVDTGMMEKYPKTCEEHNFICRAKSAKAGKARFIPTKT